MGATIINIFNEMGGIIMDFKEFLAEIDLLEVEVEDLNDDLS